MYSQLKVFFDEVIVSKPQSSRNSSIEAFVICRNYRPPTGYEPTMFNPLMHKNLNEYFDTITNPVNRLVIPFIVCGDLSGFDSDRSYSLDVSDDDDETYNL